MKHSKVVQIFSLITCLAMLLAVAINKEQKIWEKPLNSSLATNETEKSFNKRTQDSIQVIATAPYTKDIIGYAGNVPLLIYLKDNRIIKIEALKNNETPGFFESLKKKGLFNRWNQLTPSEAINAEVDAVSGATYSSKAVIQSVQRTMQHLVNEQESSTKIAFNFNIKFLAVIMVVLAGLILPLFIKSKAYRTIQLTLNILVLGFWSGSFISLSLLVNYMANGIHITVAIISLLLIFIAFVMPLLGKKNHYCTWVCPMGSLQEIVCKVSPYKIKISEKAYLYLDYFRQALWLSLMFIMWLGVGYKLMDYEAFSAFLFQQASIPVLVLCGLFIVLSFFIQRPYCRFVCLTGSLLKQAQVVK